MSKKTYVGTPPNSENQSSAGTGLQLVEAGATAPSTDAATAQRIAKDDKNDNSPDSTNPETGEASPPAGETKTAPDGQTPGAPAPPSVQSSASAADEILKKIVSFRLFTRDSYRRLLEQEQADKAKALERTDKGQEARLRDGELVFGDEDEEGPPAEEMPVRNPDLKEGLVLRDEYGVFPPAYFGRPLEEIDKGIRDKTFVVIGKKFKNKNIFRFSATRAFFLLAPWNIVRRAALYIATHQLFDLFIILTILVNCVFLAMPELSFTEDSEYVFLGIYVTEMIIKMLARGFILYSHTYLRDPWNWLDFIVIITAFVTIIIQLADPTISVGNLQGLRTFRVLRALKTVSIVPGLKTIVNALLRAFKMLFEVILLTCFCLMVFALFALQIYIGTLRQKCVLNIVSYSETPSLSYDQYYAEWIRNSSNWQVEADGKYSLCGNSSGTGICDANYTCLPDVGDNPNYGYTGFDHFGWSMLTSFQLLTLDFWENTYNNVIYTSGPWNVLFFLIVVFFGAFYLLNLMLAVVALSYEEEAINTGKEKERDDKAAAKKKKKKLHNPLYDLAADKSRVMRVRERMKMLGERRGQEVGTNVSAGDGVAAAAAATAGGQASQQKDVSPLNTRKAGNLGGGNQKTHPSLPRRHVNPQKPLVKIASMDSKDSGYSSQSQHSITATATAVKPLPLPLPQPQPQPPKGKVLWGKLSTEVLRTLDDAETASEGSAPDLRYVPFQNSRSALEFKRKNPLSKQDSMGTVSSSGIFLEKDGTSIDTSDERLAKYEKSKNVVIISADKLDNAEDDDVKGKLVDRNCLCCRRWCLCFVPWLRLENFLHVIVSDPLFDLFITCCIVVNTFFMALEHHGMSDTLNSVLDIGNIIFSSVFILEAALKILALNKYYFMNGWNVFDLVIVGASIVDMGVENIQGLSVLRTFRLLRVVKLAQSWSTMRILLTIIINTVGQLGYLTIILFLMIYIFAVMGLQLFRQDYQTFDFGGTEAERWHFKDFYHAFMMIFRVLCGEWIEPLWQCMRVSNELCMVVFLPSLVIGNFIVLNLFLALLINAFGSEQLDKHKESSSEANRLWLAVQRLKNLCCCCCPFAKKNSVNPSKTPPNVPDHIGNGIVPDGENKMNTEADKKAGNGSGPEIAKPNGVILTDASKNSTRAAVDVDDSNTPTVAQSPITLDPKAKNNTSKDVISRLSPKKASPVSPESVKKSREDPDDLELGATAESLENKMDEDADEKLKEPPSCFPKWMKKRCAMSWLEGFDRSKFGQGWATFRGGVLRVVDSRYYEWAVLFVILASSISLAFEDVNLYQKPEMELALNILNIIFCILFGIEMLMKWVAYGYTRYFSKFWTILDFCIVVISVASLVGDSLGVANLTAFRSLRTLRALRPLRAISRWQGMKIVVNSLMRAIPAIFNVFLVGIMFWLIFSIMGVQFFSGRFYKCVNTTTGNKLAASIAPNKTYCESIGQNWVNSNINFDNAAQGFLALFQVATFEGWMEVMSDAVDSTDVDQQPEFEASKYAYLYFLIFIVFGAFFTLNLLISVIIDNFNALKKKYEGSYLDAFLTENQRKYYNTLKKLGNKKPQKTIKRPRSNFLKFFYTLAMSTKFELAIVISIAMNMVVMAIEHYHQTQAFTDSLKILNAVFTCVFVLEAVVKLLGLRWHYFRVPWNIFDFLIVLLSVVDIVLDDLLNNVAIKPTMLRVVRVFRIGRVLRLIKAAKGIRKLLFALIISLPAIFNIGALLFLVLYIYTIIGMSSFGDVKLNNGLTELMNFQTFGSTIILLIRLATSAGWNDVLNGLLIDEPNCDPDYKTLTNGTKVASSFGDCGVPYLAIPFMVSFIFMVFLIVINMYIAVILENFNQAHQQEEVGITEDDFDMFYVVWERYDPHATQFIKYDQLSDFVDDLEEPLKIEKPNEITLVSFNLNIMEGDRLHCLDILMALVNKHLSHVEETKEMSKLKLQMQKNFDTQFPSRAKLKVRSTTLLRKKEDVAARTLQRAWHYHKTQKALKNITELAMRQNSLRKASAELQRNSPRATGVRALGRRLSSALASFFGSSRPGSASSGHRTAFSLSPPPSPRLSGGTRLQTLSKKGKLTNSLQVPTVSTLYPAGQDTVTQDLEL